MRIPFVAACCLATAIASAAASDRGAPLALRGTIVDESGAPLPGQVVRLLKSRALLDLGTLKTRDQAVEEVRTTTDEHGAFVLDVVPDPHFRYYYLRFYDPAGFDKVKYRLPEDLEITRQVRSRRMAPANVILRTQADWPQVKELIDRHGPGSPVGQVLRALGLPSSRTEQPEGRELWAYDREGVSYVVDGSRILETRHGAPSEPVAGAEGGDADRPTPAVRVEPR
ncbi:MAG TPA: carboxypeptidase-like regulatory domain-containing protein [Candidatus Polarisedimenticolia bacterium]|nr:carboxypeptidase-like regulatory domain-containing protein [Candidatus Polarisedimenticolia bacterium]